MILHFARACEALSVLHILGLGLEIAVIQRISFAFAQQLSIEEKFDIELEVDAPSTCAGIIKRVSDNGKETPDREASLQWLQRHWQDVLVLGQAGSDAAANFPALQNLAPAPALPDIADAGVSKFFGLSPGVPAYGSIYRKANWVSVWSHFVPNIPAQERPPVVSYHGGAGLVRNPRIVCGPGFAVIHQWTDRWTNFFGEEVQFKGEYRLLQDIEGLRLAYYQCESVAEYCVPVWLHGLSTWHVMPWEPEYGLGICEEDGQRSVTVCVKGYLCFLVLCKSVLVPDAPVLSDLQPRAVSQLAPELIEDDIYRIPDEWPISLAVYQVPSTTIYHELFHIVLGWQKTTFPQPGLSPQYETYDAYQIIGYPFVKTHHPQFQFLTTGQKLRNAESYVLNAFAYWMSNHHTCAAYGSPGTPMAFYPGWAYCPPVETQGMPLPTAAAGETQEV